MKKLLCAASMSCCSTAELIYWLPLPLFSHHIYWLKLAPQDRAGLLNQFVKSLPV